MAKLLPLVLSASLPLGAAGWSDTFLGWRYGTQFREPGIDGTVEKHILQLTHASGGAWGSNFFNADMLMSDRNDPSAGGTSGASEVYVVYRGSLSLGKLSGRDLGFGPVRDLSLTAGFDFNAKNTAFAPKKRLIVLGPTLNLKAPTGGFLELGLWAAHEQNYNGIVGKSVDFRTTWMAAAAWGLPFRTGPADLVFKGHASHVGPKGKDGFGVETRAETLADLSLLLDLGAAVGAAKGKVYLGGGFEYWNNKFGGPNDDGPAPATNRRVQALMVQAEIHF